MRLDKFIGAAVAGNHSNPRPPDVDLVSQLARGVARALQRRWSARGSANVDIAALVTNWQRAAGAFDGLVARVAADGWTRATPCAEWDVRGLVNHVTRGNHNYVLLLQGGSHEEFLRRRELDALGSDPAMAHRRSVALLTAAFQAPGTATRIVDHPLGPMSRSKALGVRAIDTVIHSWDLARAIGADERPAECLVQWVEECWDEVYADMLTPGFYAAPLPALYHADASGLQRLLRRTGRTEFRS